MSVGARVAGVGAVAVATGTDGDGVEMSVTVTTRSFEDMLGDEAGIMGVVQPAMVAKVRRNAPTRRAGYLMHVPCITFYHTDSL